MEILAHRGWWLRPEEKNSEQAFVRAFAAGYGIETDVRDLAGRLVISHDMPLGPEMSFDHMLGLYVDHGRPGELALNVKADGLQAPLLEALARHGVTSFFVFDMAVPDALGYLRAGAASYTRHSEIEPAPSFYDQAAGVWIDGFNSDWWDEAVLTTHLAAGKKLALVSPELHRRPHLETWSVWRDWPSLAQVSLCTDFPDDARKLLAQ